MYTEFWCGSLRGRDQLEYVGIDGRIILRWIFRKWDVGIQTGSSWLRIGTGGGALVNSIKEPSGSLKCGGFLD